MTEVEDFLRFTSFSSRRDVLDVGEVVLLDYMGNDLSIVNNARVSFAKFSTEFGEAEEGILKFLMKNKHSSPFEAVVFRFKIKCPLFVAREWQRHRSGSFNEWSGRYSELEPEFYVPRLENMRTQVGKPGAYTFEPLESGIADKARHIISDESHHAWRAYKDLLDMGVAKELARLVLPLNIYTQFIWTVNARNLMHFLALRTHRDAQQEIREYAFAVESLFGLKLPHTFRFWLENGRQSL